jgi:pyruvate/2-oxoglutarate/acetoin dehydrogenase E1 component
MPNVSYLRAINRALADELERDPAVFIIGEDVGQGLTNTTIGLQKRFGPDRVVDAPLSEQAFTNFATGAAMAGRRPVVEYQIAFLTLLANKMSLMSGGQVSVPVTYLLPASGWRPGWGAQHSDQTYSPFGHFGVKTVLPATPSDAYGLMVTAIRDDDPVIFFAPTEAQQVRENVAYAGLGPVPLGVGRVHRAGDDVTVVAVGHLVHEALAVAEALDGEISVEVFDPRTIYPFDWNGLAASLDKTGRLVVVDDSNRFCGVAAEIVATAAEQMRLDVPPRRVTRPDSAILGCVRELDEGLRPSRDQLEMAIRNVYKSGR